MTAHTVEMVDRSNKLCDAVIAVFICRSVTYSSHKVETSNLSNVSIHTDSKMGVILGTVFYTLSMFFLLTYLKLAQTAA